MYPHGLLHLIEKTGKVGVTFSVLISYRDPEFEWLDAIAPTSVLFFNSNQLGSEYENDLFEGSVDGTLYHFPLDVNRSHLNLVGPLADKIANNSEVLQDVIFANRLGTITDLQVGPDGNMYILANYKRGWHNIYD